jgi:hypothetical protein
MNGNHGRRTARPLVLSLVLLLAATALWPQSLIAATQTATYQLTFDATWSAATHPIGFPPNPHFSGLIGGTHNNLVGFWAPGGTASAGIEAMAEIGSKTPLDAEVQAAINGGNGGVIISGGGVSPSPGSVSVSFTVTQQHSQISIVSMIAPSPDWFVGVHDLELFENGDWLQNKVISLLPYDAGTDSGASYTSPNQDTNPQDPITLITTGGAGNGTPFGTFTLVRTDAVPAAAPTALVASAATLLCLGVGCLAMRRRRA